MIYFLYGTDTYKSRKKLHELLQLAEKKRPGAELFKITTENWNEGQFDELLVSQGLFEQKYTVVLDNLFENKEIKEYVLDRLQGLADSNQIFLMLEGKTDVSTVKKIEIKAKQVQKFDLPADREKKEIFNIFSITEGLVRKDKKHLWISYIDLISNGAVAEEIHGIFFWQVKNMILSNRVTSLADTGLSPFVYRNSLSGAKNFTEQKLTSMSSELVEMTHKVRQGEGELSIMLEKWILEL